VKPQKDFLITKLYEFFRHSLALSLEENYQNIKKMFQVKKRQPKIFGTRNHQDPSIRKKTWRFYFLFILVYAQQQNQYNL
jgi:hypothetical protein